MESHEYVTDISMLTPVCPIIREWRRNHPGEWFDITPTPVDPIVYNFLDAITEASEIITSSNDSLWRQCMYVESAQKQIVV